MTLVDTKKALEYSEAKLNFSIGPLELFEMIRNDEDVNVIDVREAFDFADGHVPGAINLPMSSWSTTFGLTSDKLNVIYSYSETCHQAANASKYFAEHGLPVAELEGGFQEWQRHNLPVV